MLLARRQLKIHEQYEALNVETFICHIEGYILIMSVHLLIFIGTNFEP
jgi:hypothetical protein